MDINTLVSINHSQPVTTSLIVAETFNKRHTHVLDKINSLDCSSDFASANFSAHAEKIKAGAVFRNSKVYTITKDGFMFLVMGFTGKKAAAIKEKYIEAFNAMAKRLQEIEQEELQTKLKAQQDKIKKLESSSYTRNTVSPPQMQHIQQICKVNVGYGKAHDTHKSFYDWLHDRYQINKYDQMTQCQCLDLCKLVDDSPYDYDYSPNELEKLIKVNDKPLFKPKRIISYEYLLSGETNLDKLCLTLKERKIDSMPFYNELKSFRYFLKSYEDFLIHFKSNIEKGFDNIIGNAVDAPFLPSITK